MTGYLLPSARRGDASDVVDIHPPKIETFDLKAKTNIDPKGYLRRVDQFRVESFGLYMAREVIGHPRMYYRESWLLPDLGVQITDWYYRPGFEQDQDFYVDVALIRPGDRSWQLVDLYLDIVVRTGRGLQVLDTDELLGALAEGYVDSRTTRSAIETSHRTVDEIAGHGYDVSAWLADEGVELTWRRHG